jgi:DnaJ homolog subfamily C member 28
MPNIEELLRQAMEEGKFDNLPGKGKPLRLDENNPHVNSDWELAYHIIKEAGYTLPWIETLHEIENDLDIARHELLRAWNWRNKSLSADFPKIYVNAEWEGALEVFQDKLDQLNKRIRDYNLEVPNARFQRPVLYFEQEVEKIKSMQIGV